MNTQPWSNFIGWFIAHPVYGSHIGPFSDEAEAVIALCELQADPPATQSRPAGYRCFEQSLPS
jgi:hypothetical protein